MRNYVLWVVWIFFLTYQNTLQAIDVRGTQSTTSWDNITDWDFVWTLNNILWFIIGLLYFIAVAFALYGGFLILTAGGEEDRVKKWKTTLIQAVIGLIVIFLASQIISWVISIFAAGGGAVN